MVITICAPSYLIDFVFVSCLHDVTGSNVYLWNSNEFTLTFNVKYPGLTAVALSILRWPSKCTQ